MLRYVVNPSLFLKCRREESCLKHLKCEICRGQHETVPHPGEASVQENSSHHAGSSLVLPSAALKVKEEDEQAVAVGCFIYHGSRSPYKRTKHECGIFRTSKEFLQVSVS